MTDHEILVVARKIRMDLTTVQAKLSELLRLAATLEPAADARACPECGLPARALPRSTTVADHRWRAHGVDSTEGSTDG